MRAFIIVLIILSVIPGCLKDRKERDSKLPEITINTPLDSQIFTPGQSIPVSGSITDNELIAEVHIHITNTSTRAILMDVHLYPASRTTTFNQSITATAGINYKIQVLAKDRAANYALNSVEVSCN